MNEDSADESRSPVQASQQGRGNVRSRKAGFVLGIISSALIGFILLMLAVVLTDKGLGHGGGGYGWVAISMIILATPVAAILGVIGFIFCLIKKKEMEKKLFVWGTIMNSVPVVSVALAVVCMIVFVIVSTVSIDNFDMDPFIDQAY